ncbi:cofactor-independent phosphoglycerate mutase [candidate division KSB3 bacterium]|uniref:Cofactor-independent phosphoglycerate mutase n=1 Tax=candidate division KSB3 bacterium TaxID=2044937 RepID=A0A2G6KJU8_9BACT|nr:MAG: cofactor-independent phosphoglycerate mutase [candidate division KSB3 bacterium]
MKYIIILGDGMADHPLDSLGGKTPLMEANTPHINALCAKANTGQLQTVPLDMPPASDVANLGVLGYDVHKVYEGRGVLEAASMNIDILPGDMGMRCNLICIEDDKIKNHSAGHISSEEAAQLIATLEHELGSGTVQFYPGVSYRHLLVMKNGVKDLACTPPHDVPGTPFKDVLIKAASPQADETARILNELIIKSQEILKNHPVNQRRVAAGKDPGNSIWPWSPGYKPSMQTFEELYGITSGAVISAVDLIQGLGKYAGFQVIHVEGVTGLYDTNYEGKAKAAVDALQEVDFVYLHIEASDEAGHEGDEQLKIKTIEYLDQRVVKYIVEETSRMDEEVAIAILPDHPTPCAIRTHVHDPVPFLIYHPGATPDAVTEYQEDSVKNGKYGLLKGNEFIKTLLQIP